MNKVATIGFTVLMAAGIAGAQDDMVMTGMPPATPAEPEVTASAALASSYVWRGQVYNNDFVLQPSITLSHYNVSFNLWANYDLAGSTASSSGGASDDISEMDLSIAYTLPVIINEMSFDVGAIYYTFPNSTAGKDVKPSTAELYVRAVVTSWEDYDVPVIPSVTVYGDVDEVNGTYVLLDVHVPYEISDALGVIGGISAGYGNTAYNDDYFADDTNAGWNDYNFYGLASYALTESVTAQLNLTYTMLEGGAIEEAAGSRYEAKEKFWGAIGVAYDF